MNLIFPPVCIHCEEETERSKYPLCRACLGILELADPSDRCPICFKLLHAHHNCRHSFRSAAVFERRGPAPTLLSYFKNKHALGFGRAMASFMVTQLDRLRWPFPDVVTSIPPSFLRSLGQSYQPNRLLAQHMAQLCNIEIFKGLKCGFDGAFYWRDQHQIADKRVLVIDDGATKEKTVFRFVTKMREGFPKTISVLNFLVGSEGIYPG